MSNDNKIVLLQYPVIQHSLETMGQSVTERLNELNIDNLVATEDTIGTLKKLRADLNKESKEFEMQRKAIKEAVLTPYNEFEAVYKEQIITKYKLVDETLKEKINSFEMQLKTALKTELEKYFEEIRDMEQLDWLTFKSLNIDINLSTSPKKYKEQILKTVQDIVSDLDLIKTDQHSAEILVEYKKDLNVSQAIKTVRERKTAEKIEADRQQLEMIKRRTAQLHSLGFVYHDLNRTYNWVTDESVMIKYSDVEAFPDDDWTKKYVEFENIIRERKPKPIQKPTILGTPVINVPKAAPKQEAAPETFEAKFMVTDTYERLTKLSNYLKENGYNYQNID